MRSTRRLCSALLLLLALLLLGSGGTAACCHCHSDRTPACAPAAAGTVFLLL
jgi:hypothetical protein